MNYDIIEKKVDFIKKIEIDNFKDIFNLSNFSKDEILFIDTETTGLSGGSGTFIFLYSFGYFENDIFIITQIFLKNFSQEKEALDIIANFLQMKSFYLSFNGKSFDLPLIKNRFIMNQKFEIFDIIENKFHIDLYHISRILYKDRFPKYNLQTLEKELLGFFREDDLDSQLVPYEYFKYIRGEPANITKILEHNYYDVLSLLNLIDTFEKDLVSKNERINYYNLIFYLIKNKKYNIAKKLLLKDKLYLKNEMLFYSYIVLLKKEKYFEKICELFEKYYDTFNFYESLFVEYLKILEHYKKDYKKAIELYKKEKLKMQLIELVNEDISKRINRINDKYYREKLRKKNS